MTAIVRVHHIFFIHLSTDRYLGCFHIWLLWIGLLWTFSYNFSSNTCFYYLEYIPRSGIDGLYDKSVCNSLKNYPAVLHRCCTILHSQLPCTWYSISLYPYNIYFFIRTILIGISGISLQFCLFIFLLHLLKRHMLRGWYRFQVYIAAMHICILNCTSTTIVKTSSTRMPRFHHSYST